MINWKLRLKNKATLVAIILGVITLAYQILDAAGVVPAFSQERIVSIAMAIVDLLVLAGIIIDPTTSGISDSARALNYTTPFKDETK